MRAILVLAAPIGRLSPDAVAAAIDDGLRPSGREIVMATEVDQSFDHSLHNAGALIVTIDTLEPATLRNNPFADAATRARQSGVPCFAIVGTNTVDAFGQRILDLQDVREARTSAELASAAQALAPHLPTS